MQVLAKDTPPPPGTNPIAHKYRLGELAVNDHVIIKEASPEKTEKARHAALQFAQYRGLKFTPRAHQGGFLVLRLA